MGTNFGAMHDASTFDAPCRTTDHTPPIILHKTCQPAHAGGGAGVARASTRERAISGHRTMGMARSRATPDNLQRAHPYCAARGMGTDAVFSCPFCRSTRTTGCRPAPTRGPHSGKHAAHSRCVLTLYVTTPSWQSPGVIANRATACSSCWQAADAAFAYRALQRPPTPV